MDNREEVREFLASRRAKLTPEQAGIPTYGGKRRVAGLRRGEVAELAGVSIEYYTRLERGNLGGASETVIEAVAGALQLDEAERNYLFNLARAASGGARRKSSGSEPKARPIVHRLLDSLELTPATVLNGRLDVVASNALARALFSDIFEGATGTVNMARFCFFDAKASALYRDWNEAANITVAILRAEAGKNPYDKELSDLVGELSTRSEEFRVRWAAHNVRLHQTGVKRLHHPVVGDLDLPFETLELADPGLSLLAYSAEPGSPSEEALKLLASWAASTVSN